MIVYEAKFKWQASDTLGLDIALFYNDYDQLRSSQIGAPICQPSGTPPNCFFTSPSPTSVLVPLQLGDLGDVPLTAVERSVYGQVRWEF